MRNDIKKIRILPIILLLIVIISACTANVDTPPTESESRTETETVIETERETTGEAESDHLSETEGVSETDEQSSENTQSSRPSETQSSSEKVPSSQPSTTKPSSISVPVSTTAAHRHSYTKKVTPPTCTSDGYTTYTCSCGYSYTDNFTKATGHSFGNWQTVKAPTTTSEGTEKRTCSVCGVSETKKIAKLPAGNTNFQQEVLSLVNEERTKRGLSPLTYCYEAQKAADLRAEEIQKTFAHSRPDGRDCFTVFDDLKINRFMCGENIAYGYPTPEDVVIAWMNSEGHRANILNKNAKELAVSMKNNYWVQIFVA